MTVHPVFDELVEGDGQFAVIVPTVVRVFDSNSVENETSFRSSPGAERLLGALCLKVNSSIFTTPRKTRNT